jgi:penicillin-binding protein 1C
MRVSRRARVPLGLAIGALALAFWQSLPDPLFGVPFSRVLLDRNGALLGASIADDEQWRFPPPESVPEKYRTAVLRFEDRRFESHPGVDPLAVLRAAARNWREGRIASGASTITMQVIRLARRGRERTFWEKVVEALLALRLELTHDKDAILGLYAGHAPFGGNVVGLEAAAWRYFGRRAADLSWAESCTLAVLPNSPALIHPGRNRDRLRAKRDALLREIHEVQAIDALELSLALREPLPDAPRPLPRLAPHLLETLTARSESEDGVFVSTLDRDLQARAVERVLHHVGRLEPAGVRNAAALVVDNRTFEVRAYVGNGRTRYAMRDGHAVDLIPRPRSTGSILKPLLFAAMIENGDLLPDTLVSDVPTQYQGYMPENFDRAYRGAVPARIALSRSLNVPSVRMLRRYGVARFRSLLLTLGMSTLHRSADDYGLTLILGGAEGTLWDITGIYANLANLAGEARSTPPLRTPTLEVAPALPAGPPAPFGPGTAWLTLDALTQVSRPDSEGAWREFESARRIAWKTGTSYGLRDAWAVGTTPEFTIGVWVGNASGDGVAGLSGVDFAAPLLFDLFDGLETSARFPTPHPHLRTVRVCADDGFLANDLCRAKETLAPREGRFSRVSPFHTLVHLDASGSFQVDSRCTAASKIETRPWFVLPPREEHYFRTHHTGYRPLPPVHPDCEIPTSATRRGPIALLYPGEGTAVYVPTDLDGEPSRAIFEAVHRDADAVVHWHLDERYVATTQAFHQIAVDTPPGRHRLTLVDQAGRLLERSFEVLGGSSPASR